VKNLWAVACAVLAVWTVPSAVGRGTAIADNSAIVPHARPPANILSSTDHPPSAASSNYKIGPEDVLHISVWENKELTLEVVVRPDGMISVPLVQDVQAEGLTAAELADVIYQKLLVYLKEPQVSVIVKQVNAPKIFVIGNVVRPGPYPLRSDMSILQALSLAGGFTQFASPRSIKLVRGLGLKQEVRKINYYRLIDNVGEGNYLLQPGDTIVVP
jgi:polysaccharide export outer membrane protein